MSDAYGAKSSSVLTKREMPCDRIEAQLFDEANTMFAYCNLPDAEFGIWRSGKCFDTKRVKPTAL
jgi:hypothetical protein